MNNNFYYKTEKTIIINNDFLSVDCLPKNYFDLTVTSPPYNVGKKYNNGNDNLSYDEYLDFSFKWLKKVYDYSKPDGRLCMNIPLDTGKGEQRSIGADLTHIAKETGWKYKTTIIWNEGHISKPLAKGSYMSASCPNIIAPVELIVVMYKDYWKKQKKGITNITKKEFDLWTNGFWTFSGESKKKIGHPAPFPLELSNRCIKLFSFENDIILDPFVGSGTTLISAEKIKRKAIGIEISEEYCKLCVNRLTNEKN